MSTDHNRNPAGKNQYGTVASLDDPELVRNLRELHAARKVNNDEIANIMTERGFPMSGSTVKRRRKKLGLVGSRAIGKVLTSREQEQAVLDQVERDPVGHHGPRTVMAAIAYKAGYHIPRHVVEEVMHTHAPDGFKQRAPGAKQIPRTVKCPIGIHERWSCDGHDKNNRIGFQVYGIVDDATGMWLGAWLVPNNREGTVVAYIYLTLAIEQKGIPIQTASDCGSETTQMYGLQEMLREKFYLNKHDVPAHSYVRSVHNISIERAWRQLRSDWGDNAISRFEEGDSSGAYDPEDPVQYNLARWLWSQILQASLTEAVKLRNNIPMRKDTKKFRPVAGSRQENFDKPERWGGRNCINTIDTDFLLRMRDEIGDESLLSFVPADFAAIASAALDQLPITELTPENGWYVFAELLSLLQV